MKTQLSLICSTFLMLIVVSCDKSDNYCEAIDFVPINFSEYKTISIENNEVTDKFLVIDFQEDFQAKVILTKSDSENTPDIDFSKYTLLIGKKKIGGIEGSLISQSVKKSCRSNKYIYSVDIKKGGYTALGNFYFGVLIPNIQNASVEFDVQVID